MNGSDAAAAAPALTTHRYRAPVQALCLAGPTASGKSALALSLARRWPMEIISVDSAQVYRGMDIGTAKPSAAEQAQVPHHLIDIQDPAQSYSAARFVADATQLVADIRARGRLPLLVGGTMLYFKALRQGISAMPAANPALRVAIDHEAQVQGWPALHEALAQVDPETAARLAPRDGQRIQRALEVWRSTGRTLTDWHRQDPARSGPDADAAWPLLALEPASRAWLHARIEQRLQQMVARGLEAEVRALRQRGDLNPQLPSMRSVGYRQAWAALDAAEQAPPTRPPKADRAPWFDPALAATRQLAKHQLTWLRGVPGRTVLNCESAALEDDAHRWVQGFMQF